VAEPLKPSDVILAVPPLCACFGRAEREFAASLIVRACQVLGDKWQPIEPKQIGEVLEADVAAKTEPFASLTFNPVFRPDVWGLVEKGFARWTGEPGRTIELTEAGIAGLEKWRKP
jgi:hypothetical protein